MFGPGLAAFLDRDLHQLADTSLIDRGKGISFHDFQLGVVRQKRAAVVATHAERSLSEIIRAEAEELCRFRDLIRGQRAARHFDHRANQISEFHFFRGLNFLCDAMDDLDLQVEFSS